jgi:hypothetical protein
MLLNGSCHCRRVTFSIESAHPYPFNLCYCSICRKTAGSGGYGINLGGEAASLQVDGEAHISVYRALLGDPESGEFTESPAERRFCRHCGSPLWVWDPRWPELIHPFAGAIDTPLPIPPERVHLMLGSKASWVQPPFAPGDQQYPEYPQESIADWHAARGLET